jgi:enoyl-[acyl-carrier protein] reductase II
MMLRTPLSAELGLTTPIISAGMAFVAGPVLAAAVSRAGGLGLLGGAMVPPPKLRAMVAETRSLTDQPFGVGLIGDFMAEEHLTVLASERVAVASFFWTLPTAAQARRLRDAGVRVWMQVGSVDEARRAVALGAQAIIVQGSEAGGHNRAEAGIFALLPVIRDVVAPLPVIAAGGVVDGRGLAAVLALGAEAALCGTRFLATPEANAHPDYQARLVSAGPGDTRRTTLFGPEWPGQPMRVIANAAVRDWAGREAEAALLPPGDSAGSIMLDGERRPLPRHSAILPTWDYEGDLDRACLTAGEGSGNINSVEPAGAIVARMTQDALLAIGMLGRSVS